MFGHADAENRGVRESQQRLLVGVRRKIEALAAVEGSAHIVGPSHVETQSQVLRW